MFGLNFWKSTVHVIRTIDYTNKRTTTVSLARIDLTFKWPRTKHPVVNNAPIYIVAALLAAVVKYIYPSDL